MCSRPLEDMSSRRLKDMSSRRLKDVFNVAAFRLPRRLKVVFKASSRRLARCLQDVFEEVKLLRWRRVEDVFKMLAGMSPTIPSHNNAVMKIRWWRFTPTSGSNFALPCLNKWVQTHFVLLTKIFQLTSHAFISQ